MTAPIVFDEAYLERTLRIAFEDPESYMVPKGIIRHDYGNTHAWRVSVARDKAKFVEYFFDGQAGSVENGLRTAILYRHEIIEAFPVTIKIKYKRELDPDPEKRIRRRSEPGTLQPYVHWMAVWHDEHYKRQAQSFSVLKFGEDEARQLALEAATKNHNPVRREHTLPDAYAIERWRPHSRASVEQAAATNDYSYRRAHGDPAVNDSYPFGYEGAKRAKLHMAIERDRVLRNKKVSEFLKANGRLFCELCSFSFKDSYPFLSKDIIEVHHLAPLASLGSTTRVDTRDLMLLCSNCHTAIHQGDAEANMVLAREHTSAGHILRT